MRGVQGVDLVEKSGRATAVFKGSVAAIDEERGAQLGIKRSGENVGQAVAGEVVEDTATSLVCASSR